MERYKEVMDAYLDGLDAAAEAGHDLSTIHSVASFFVSRVDTEIDKRLEAIGTPEALELRGKAALANARLAYAAYQEVFEVETRFPDLQAQGARAQRPLWASTGVKNPEYPDTLYVSELVAPNTVNTMPGKTMDAFADHGWVNTGSIIGKEAESREIFEKIRRWRRPGRRVRRPRGRGRAQVRGRLDELLTATAEELAAANKG